MFIHLNLGFIVWDNLTHGPLLNKQKVNLNFAKNDYFESFEVV